ncbi:hypothetical protein LTR49_027139 [Elasticomyces elasticus]|nr:hypothetical protein LTR49_027139 [Elasticomyces elasticus]
MAGTNDINGNDDVDDAPTRLANLIDECVSACPDAVVIVAQITPIANSDSEARSQTFNAAIPDIVNARVAAGHHVLTVDMQGLNGLTTADLNDGLHPTDEGYAKMANVWLSGLNQAAASNWITPPV